MTAASSTFRNSDKNAPVVPFKRALMLVRIACSGGATRAEIMRDLGPIFTHKLSPGEWRQLVTDANAELLAQGLAVQSRGRMTVSSIGREAADTFLGRKGSTSGSWQDVRDGRLVAKALGLNELGPKRIKELQRPDGLRALIIQKAFGLPLNGSQTVSKLRAQLAVVALERAFGNKIKTGLGAGSGFSAQAGRMLAGQLSIRPRDFGSDAKLVAALAAEAVDARQTDLESLRGAILRRLAQSALNERVDTDVPAPVLRQAANDAGLPGAAMPANRRPDPASFARQVQIAAQGCAEGWSGNRKALIMRVWKEIAAQHPEWGLSEIEFKCMLGEAHRAGHLALASADLKDKRNADELNASAVTYKNTVWHLVRVEDVDS